MSSNLPEGKPKPNEHISWKEKEEFGYVFDERNGSMYTLNKMALSIWKLCDGNHTILEIANELTRTYNLRDSRDAEEKTVELLNDFIGNGVIKCEE